MTPAGSLRHAVECGRIFSEHRHALGHAWCWPADSDLATFVRDRGIAQPSLPDIGDVLLVSVSKRGDRAGLWRWSAAIASEGAHRPLSPTVSAALPRLRSIVGAAIRVQFISPAGVSVEAHRVTPIFQHGCGADAVLEGDSFGLALALGLASQFWQCPIPSTLVALAAVGDDGRLAGVDGLRGKLALVASSALGVTRVVVAGSQMKEATRLCSELAPRIFVVGHEHLCEVLDALARDLLPGGLPPSWTSESGGTRLAQASQALFDLARSGHPTTSWSAVAIGAESIAKARPTDARLCAMTATTVAIARRHIGEHAPLPWPFAQDAHRDDLIEDDWQLMAHVVQAAADAGHDDADTLRERARTWVGRQRLAPMLIVLGAVQRSYAITRRYVEASELGAEVAAHWRRRSDPARASYAVCEWLRTANLVGDADPRTAEEAAHWILDAIPARDGRNAAYIRMALGQFMSAHGRTLDEIASVIGPGAAQWDRLDPREFLTRARTWHRTLWQAGRYDEARSVREALPTRESEPRVRLVDLEVQLMAGAADVELIETLRALRDARPQALRWLLEEGLSPRAQARRIVSEYAY